MSPDPDHQGTGGQTSEELVPLVPALMRSYRPDVVLLMIGTNDVDVRVDLANAPARLASLIDKIVNTSSDAALVVAQIVPTTDATTDARVRTFNAAIPAIVKARADAGKKVFLVDMHGAFTAVPNYKSALMKDRLHPNNAGYAVMAATWYAAIAEWLPHERMP